MVRAKRRTATQVAAERLRALVLDTPEGALIGSEDSLVARLECSRSTVRQVARLLEREGLLKVRRGINGGYFGMRPTAETVASSLGAHLEALQVSSSDTITIATALWVVAVRAAATADKAMVGPAIERLTRKLRTLESDACFDRVREFELAFQREIFALAQSPYIKLIFDVNATFSRRQLHNPPEDRQPPGNAQFVQAWREAKMIELSALGSGNETLASAAAQHSRAIWVGRIQQRHAMMDDHPG